MKKIPEIRFPEFSGEWVEKRLGDIGITYSGLTNKNKEHFNKGNDYYIPFTNIMNNVVVDSSNLEKVTIFPNENQTQVKEGDILFTASSETPNEVGMCAVYLDNKEVYLNSFCFGFRMKTLNVDSLFLVYLLRYKRNLFYKIAQGSTRYNLSKKNFNDIKIYIPPTLAEQKKIAKFLSSIDKEIEIISKKIEELKKYKKTLLHKLLNVDDKGEPELRFKGFSGNWVEKRLGELVEKAKSGGTPKSTVKKYYNGNIPFLSISDMTQQGKYITKTAKTISEDGLKNSSAWIVPINSIIYSMYASVGFVSINKIPLATSQAVINLVIKDKYDVEYIYYYLFWFKKYIHRYIETGTQGNLNAQIVKNLKIYIPPTLKEQEKIASFLSSIDKEIELNEKKLKFLKKYKKGLLQKMFI